MSNPFQSAARPTTEQASLSPEEDERDDEPEPEQEAEAERRAPTAAAAAAASSSPHRSRSPPSDAGSPSAASLPPEDLNVASAARIRAALGRTSVFPDKIVAERAEHGPFSSIADLKRRVPGLGKVKLKLISDGGLTIGDPNAQPQPILSTVQPTQPDPAPPTPLQPLADPLIVSQPVQPIEPAQPVASVLVAVAPQPSQPPQQPSETDSLPIHAPLLLPAASSSSSSTSVSIASPPAPQPESMREVVEPNAAASSVAAPAPQPSSQTGCWSRWLCCAPADPPPKHAHNSEPQPSAPVADAALAQIELQLANLNMQPQPPAPAPSDVSSTAPRPPYSIPSLRVGSWNLCHFNVTKGRNVALMSVVSDVLVRQRFDVVVLIEVRCKEVCDILLNEFLNNPARQIPPSSLAVAAGNDGVGHWKYELSECMEYGSEVHSIANGLGLGSGQPELVLEADIIEESTTLHPNGIVHERAQSSARLEQSSAQLQPAEHEEDDIAASLTTLTITEHTRTVVSDGAGLSATSTHASSSFTSSSVLQQTPVKNRNSLALSPSEHHRRSSGGSNGSARKSHSKKEYCAVFYRSDRVELPQGCRLFQSKAGPASARKTNNDAADSSNAYQWWRSPCCVLVRPLPALLREYSLPPSVDPVSWLLVALHVVWGNGESDIVRECSHLQQLYCSVLSEIERDVSSTPNTAVALLGDFNLSYHTMEFQRHCLSLDRFAALVERPACSTFSQKKQDCNLYDQVFTERAVMDALIPADHAVSAGVVYFDRAYFPVDASSSSSAPSSSPPSDAAALAAAAAMKSRIDAKKISDHRPVYSDLPCCGNVRGVASSVMTKMAPVPVTPPKAAPAPGVEAGLGSAAAPAESAAASASGASTTASAVSSLSIPPLSSLLSIVVVTSAIPIHPATTVIDSVIHSFRLMPELAGLPVTIMCDHPKRIVDDAASDASAGSTGLPPDAILYKRGVISSSRFAAYRQYIAALRSKYASRPEIEIVELPSYHGFAHCVKDALIRYVNTPYVLVAQHDYIFTQSSPIRELVSAMYASHSWKHQRAAATAAAAAAASPSTSPLQYPPPPSPLNYIGFTHKRSQNYLELAKRGMPPALAADPMLRLYEATSPAAAAASSSSSSSTPRLLLSPLLFQYDKLHLASVRYLLEDVLMHPKLQAVGTFIEDEWGVSQIEEIRACAAAISRAGPLASPPVESPMQLWARKYGTYLFFHDPSGLRINLKHIHGRRFEQQKVGGLRRFVPPDSSSNNNEDCEDSDDEETKARLDLFRME